MKRLVCQALGIETFSEEKMDAAIEKAVVNEDEVVLHFLDGTTQCFRFANKKHGTKHTAEYKQHMSQMMKGKWEMKKCGETKGNNDTGDHQ